MANKKRNNNWPMMVLVAVVALGIGFIIGRMNLDIDKAHSQDKNEALSLDENDAVKKNTTSPEELAKKKNVPAKIESPEGDYTLVAVVEGEDANKSLHRSLQLVNVQRQRLGQLSQQYDQTASTQVQQRELIAGQINEMKRTLGNNLKFMAKNFAYTLSNNYFLVPQLATLSFIEGEGKDQKKTLVFTFEDAASYEEFQKKSSAYGKLKREQLREHQAKLPKPGDPSKASVQTGAQKPLPLTDAMKTARAEMMELYKCDPEKSYVLDFQKTALYAREAK